MSIPKWLRPIKEYKPYLEYWEGMYEGHYEEGDVQRLLIVQVYTHNPVGWIPFSSAFSAPMTPPPVAFTLYNTKNIPAIWRNKKER